MGGLFLMYRGLIDYRVPLLIVLSAFVTIMLVPVPVVIAENVRHWRSLSLARPGVGWATAITFANYEILCGPLLLVGFYFATAANIRPMTRRGRAMYSILIGSLAAVMQLYVDVSYGPYVALLVVSILTPLLDRIFGPRPLA
jgi:electron transport complex protein RnfD